MSIRNTFLKRGAVDAVAEAVPLEEQELVLVDGRQLAVAWPPVPVGATQPG